eukprot:TRINITY_DN15371_c0_g1_i1.p1 TRINITY_DN15371_c0_g1~~TRINITY_DN15371_c0_g1_i1.p1  ORF type:complete len:1355 (-),score=147.91 TRINITY_DN15371_c0_g1_i1:277-4290(-)
MSIGRMGLWIGFCFALVDGVRQPIRVAFLGFENDRKAAGNGTLVDEYHEGFVGSFWTQLQLNRSASSNNGAQALWAADVVEYLINASLSEEQQVRDTFEIIGNRGDVDVVVVGTSRLNKVVMENAEMHGLPNIHCSGGNPAIWKATDPFSFGMHIPFTSYSERALAQWPLGTRIAILRNYDWSFTRISGIASLELARARGMRVVGPSVAWCEKWQQWTRTCEVKFRGNQKRCICGRQSELDELGYSSLSLGVDPAPVNEHSGGTFYEIAEEVIRESGFNLFSSNIDPMIENFSRGIYQDIQEQFGDFKPQVFVNWAQNHRSVLSAMVEENFDLDYRRTKSTMFFGLPEANGDGWRNADTVDQDGSPALAHPYAMWSVNGGQWHRSLRSTDPFFHSNSDFVHLFNEKHSKLPSPDAATCAAAGSVLFAAMTKHADRDKLNGVASFRRNEICSALRQVSEYTLLGHTVFGPTGISTGRQSVSWQNLPIIERGYRSTSSANLKLVLSTGEYENEASMVLDFGTWQAKKGCPSGVAAEEMRCSPCLLDHYNPEESQPIAITPCRKNTSSQGSVAFERRISDESKSPSEVKHRLDTSFVSCGLCACRNNHYLSRQGECLQCSSLIRTFLTLLFHLATRFIFFLCVVTRLVRVSRRAPMHNACVLKLLLYHGQLWYIFLRICPVVVDGKLGEYVLIIISIFGGGWWVSSCQFSQCLFMSGKEIRASQPELDVYLACIITVLVPLFFACSCVSNKVSRIWLFAWSYVTHPLVTNLVLDTLSYNCDVSGLPFVLAIVVAIIVVCGWPVCMSCFLGREVWLQVQYGTELKMARASFLSKGFDLNYQLWEIVHMLLRMAVTGLTFIDALSLKIFLLLIISSLFVLVQADNSPYVKFDDGVACPLEKLVIRNYAALVIVYSNWKMFSAPQGFRNVLIAALCASEVYIFYLAIWSTLRACQAQKMFKSWPFKSVFPAVVSPQIGIHEGVIHIDGLDMKRRQRSVMLIVEGCEKFVNACPELETLGAQSIHAFLKLAARMIGHLKSMERQAKPHEKPLMMATENALESPEMMTALRKTPTGLTVCSLEDLQFAITMIFEKECILEEFRQAIYGASKHEKRRRAGKKWVYGLEQGSSFLGASMLLHGTENAPSSEAVRRRATQSLSLNAVADVAEVGVQTNPPKSSVDLNPPWTYQIFVRWAFLVRRILDVHAKSLIEGISFDGTNPKDWFVENQKIRTHLLKACRRLGELAVAHEAELNAHISSNKALRQKLDLTSKQKESLALALDKQLQDMPAIHESAQRGQEQASKPSVNIDEINMITNNGRSSEDCSSKGETDVESDDGRDARAET